MSLTPEFTLSIFEKHGLEAEIVRAPDKLHVVEYKNIENALGHVIIDSSTLFAAGRTFSKIVEGGLTHALSTCCLTDILGTLNLLQSMIIHEKMWVDALTFGRSKNSGLVASNFADYINGFLITEQEVYDNTLIDVNSLCSIIVEQPVSNADTDLVTVEEIDREYFHPRHVFAPPTDASTANTIIYEYQSGQESKHLILPDLPTPLASSNSGHIRTLFYITISCAMRHPYVPHPDRAKFIEIFFNKKQSKYEQSVAQRVLEQFDKEVLSQWNVSHINFDVPPVAEYLLQKSGNQDEFLETIQNLRNQASEFRKWCQELEHAYSIGKPGVAKIQKMEQMLNAAIEKWSIDLDEEVRYKTRKIQFPLFEKFLKIDGISSLTIKDPILWSKYKPLLFLNSLGREMK